MKELWRKLVKFVRAVVAMDDRLAGWNTTVLDLQYRTEQLEQQVQVLERKLSRARGHVCSSKRISRAHLHRVLN